MRTILIAVTCLIATIVQAVPYTNAPSFTNGQFYVWTSGATATNALNAINLSGWFPVVGKNAQTGKDEPDAQKTEKWADEVKVRTDGKFVIPRIPTALFDLLGVPENVRKAWWDTFLPDVEVYQDDWFPADVE